MFSYHHIQVIFLGKKYPAKLYGDRIDIAELDVSLNRSEITSFKLSPFNNYKINTNRDTFSRFEVAPLAHMARWLDPFYYARFAMLLTIFTVSLLGSFFTIGLSGWWAALFFALTNTLMTYLFSRWVKLPIGKLVLFSASSYLFLGLVSFYVLPLVGALLLYLLFPLCVILTLIFYSWLRSQTVIKYYVIATWLLFIICNFNVMLFVFNTAHSQWARIVNKGPVLEKNAEGSHIRLGSHEFKIPFIWQSRSPRLAEDLVNFRNVLYDLNPFSTQHIFSYEVDRKHVLLASSRASVQRTREMIERFLRKQSYYIYTAYVAQSKPVSLPIKELHSHGILDAHIIFDLKKLDRVVLYTFTVPIYKHRFIEGSAIFSFLLDEDVAPERLTQIIIDGFNGVKK